MNNTLSKPLRLLAVAAAVATALLAAPGADAQDNPYERGPAPTEASVTADRGPFAIAQINVPGGSGPGFNRGTIYYPTSTGEGTFGAVAVMPGFVSAQSAIAWLGPRLASQGFVVFTLDSVTPFDFPDPRSTQLLAALDYLTTRSQVRDRIDATRLAVMGHSMGGGASLRAAETRPALQAAVPLAPWQQDKTWNAVRVPTMIIGAENDSVAPVASHAEPFYTSMTSAPDKAYLEMESASHSTGTVANSTVGKFALSWLKRFVDNDTRYDQFLCPPPPPSSAISEYRDTCPHA